MLKTLLASGVAVSAVALASPAQADSSFYLNPEWNGGWTGSDFSGAVFDGHVGYKAGGFYIQGGPSWVQPDAGETEVGFSAKTGVSAPVAEELDVYGEVSFAKYKDADAGYGLKAGLVYEF
tara:strand:- start:42 stop:404 length:363 start_codon:yes stop_codon:yes gene_type:complete